ncbi:putative ABC transporter ATP-binding protein [Candidatus Magnetaquicoccaceae bacterium FCR-1]|uniref:ABC transporter ATP-binding protein n=1 Tax=Candidatus Magnetaquiglobus chichijimensis TaxID=3141448 RepID=A0ABQ0C8B5_9PROT
MTRDTPGAGSVANDPLASLTGIEKSYVEEGAGLVPILTGLNADFQRGTLTALVGRSGSGKTTLLNLIAGLDRPDRGRIFIGGEESTAFDDETSTRFRRRHIGFVFQFFNLVPSLTVLENVRFPLALNGADDAEGTRRALELLERVGLERRAAAFPDRLSGGERQRAAIARALIHRPMLVCADEPTGNLDHKTARGIMALMTAMVREEGTTLIMVTHSLDFAAQADRVLFLEEGRLVEDAR